jgi:hypothetical protein
MHLAKRKKSSRLMLHGHCEATFIVLNVISTKYLASKYIERMELFDALACTKIEGHLPDHMMDALRFCTSYYKKSLPSQLSRA